MFWPTDFFLGHLGPGSEHQINSNFSNSPFIREVVVPSYLGLRMPLFSLRSKTKASWLHAQAAAAYRSTNAGTSVHRVQHLQLESGEMCVSLHIRNIRTTKTSNELKNAFQLVRVTHDSCTCLPSEPSPQC